MIKPTVVYPFSFTSALLPRYQTLSNYKIASVVVPGKLSNKVSDASFYDEGEPMGIPVSFDLSSQLSNIDTVIWAEYDYMDNFRFRDHVFNQISDILRQGKEVVCTQPLNDVELKRFYSDASQFNGLFHYLDNKIYADEIFSSSALKKIEVPIISVYGTIENCSKFETQLMLRQKFLSNGYRVSQVGSRHYSSLYNVHPFPRFMFETGHTEAQKILGFNSWLREISNVEQPDVIIVGVPGGLMPVNTRYHFNFVIIAYLVSCAIEPDFSILNVPFEEIDTQYVEMMRNLFRYRFSTQIDCIAMSNVRLNRDSVMSNFQPLEYDVMPHKYLMPLIAKWPQSLMPLFSAVDYHQQEQLFQYICSHLSGNNERVV